MDFQNINGCDTCLGRGCKFCKKEGEAELSADVVEGCFKLHTTDWLADYPNNLPTDIVEVRFKNTHRGYYSNANNLPLEEGDIVAVEASPGHDIGIVSLTGDMVSRQMRRVGFNPQNGEFRKIYRKARGYDLEKWHEAIAREHETMIRSRQIAAEMNLDMKIGDVEFQGDGIKAIFYYIADERVDFRELIKVFADQFRIRIEMKQIGARQEAGRIGGLGACGRRLCCASWISSFNSVTTNAARTQDLSLNPQKLAGQCSKLKCCLVYELDDYIDARKEFPRVNEPLHALDADYYHVKDDILARTMSFSTDPHSLVGLVTLSIDRVREIQKMNAEGTKPEKINSDKVYNPADDEPTFVNMVGEESITRFDRSRNNRNKKKNRNGNGNNNRNDRNAAGEGQQRSAQQQGGDNRQPRQPQPQRQQGGRPNGQNGQKAQGDRNTAANDGQPGTQNSNGGQNGSRNGERNGQGNREPRRDNRGEGQNNRGGQNNRAGQNRNRRPARNERGGNNRGQFARTDNNAGSDAPKPQSGSDDNK